MDLELTMADQVGIVVSDLEAFLRQLECLLGLKDFNIIEYTADGTDPEKTYQGKRATYRLLMAFKTVGNLQLEIVQPLEGQSIYQDFLSTHGPGLHHIRFSETNFEAVCEALTAKGIQMLANGPGVNTASKWAYFDTSAQLEGLVIEIRKPG